MRICITGHAGYVGSALVPALLEDGHEVVGYDIEWFGRLVEQKGLTQIKGDIRDLPSLTEAMSGCEAVISLACVSNDTSCGLDEALSTSINYDAFRPMVVAARTMHVKRFIYCSSSSVYGISNAPDVREDHPCIPLTLYNTYKSKCEPLLINELNDTFTGIIIRPATICGAAPRQRFDLTINALTRDAVKKGKMTVFGGEQRRPNLHLFDMIRAYKLFLEAPHDLIQGQAFNVGTQNMSLLEVAEMVREVVKEKMGIDAPYERVSHTDNRSYHINSDKIRDVLGFVPEKSIADAVRDMCDEFLAGRWADALTSPVYSNVVQLQKYGFARKD